MSMIDDLEGHLYSFDHSQAAHPGWLEVESRCRNLAILCENLACQQQFSAFRKQKKGLSV